MNILSQQESGISLVKLLLIYYLINISTNSPLLSKRLTELIDENRLIKHLVGFITIIVLITLLQTGNISNSEIFIYAFLCYSWFILATKLNIHLNLILVLCLLMGYMYENMIKNKDIDVLVDKVLTEDEKTKIIHSGETNKKYVMWGLVGLTAVGVYFYSEHKEVQYGGGYNLVTFLLY